MTYFFKCLFLLAIICASCLTQADAAGCAGGGSTKGYTPPSASAGPALDILNAANGIVKPPTAAAPIQPTKPVVTPTQASQTTPVTTTPVTPSAPAATTTPAEPPIAGKVAWTKGTLKVVGADKKVRVLQKGSPIYAEDTIVTDGKSQAEVVFTDNTLVTFDKNTVFNVTKYNYNPESKSPSVGTYIMNLIVGSYRTVTGAIAKTNPNDYKVNTEVAVMGVRGTDYSASFGACKTNMKYHSGTPFIENAKGTVVLTQSAPYATVKSADMPPVSVKVEPAVFQKTLPVIPATVNSIKTMPPLSKSDIGVGGAGGTGSGGGGGICTPGASGGGFNVKIR